MKNKLLKNIMWAITLGLCFGFIVGVIEFILAVRRRFIGGASEALIYFSYVTSFYSCVWLIVLLGFGLIIIILSRLLKNNRGFSEKLLDLNPHLLGAGAALFIYVFNLMEINDQLLPTAIEPKSILGNILFLAICMTLSFIFYFIIRMISRWIKPLKLKRALSYFVVFLGLIAAINIFIVAFGSPKNWITSLENEWLNADVEPEEINVVLITIDALRPDHLSCYGYHRQTPAIDSLARVSCRFDNAIAQSSWTFFSFTSMMTSLYPDAISNCQQVPLDPARTTLAEVLAANGFKTAAVLTNPFLINLWNIIQGFNYISHPDQPRIVQNIVGTQLYIIIGRLNSKLFLRENANILSRRAMYWLEKNKGQRFFLWIHYIEPHLPYGDPWNDLWPPDPEYNGKIGNNWGDYIGFLDGRYQFDESDLRHLKYLYDGDIFYVDHQLKKVFDYLKKEKLWDKSLIILTSDHGEEFMEHGGLHHGRTLHKEVVHVPLIIKLPDQSAAKFIPDQVQLIDLAPTVLDIAGLPAWKQMAGKSLVPVIRGEDRKLSPAFSACNTRGDNSKLIQYDRYSLIYNEDELSIQLYDREGDPFESLDIYEIDRETADQLENVLKDHLNNNLALFNKMEKVWESKKIQISETQKQRMRALGYLK